MAGKFISLAVASALLAGSTAGLARAQDGREAQMLGLHQMCFQGNDRKACIRFGMMLQQHHDRMNAWRRSHPDWFWYEH